MLKIGLLTLFKQFPTQKVAGMISFSYICKQKNVISVLHFQDETPKNYSYYRILKCKITKTLNINMNNRITEGYMPFMGYQTYYRIVGEPSEKAPLLLLHGGPGSTHNYFEVLDCIAETGRQVVSYDQIGCGNSYLDGHPELWTLKTWIDELIAIREHLHLDMVHIL